MDKTCTICGKTMPDGQVICPYCGNVEAEAYHAEYASPVETDMPRYEDSLDTVPAVPSGKRRKVWWPIPVAIVLVIAIAAVFLWQPVMLHFAPQAYLAMAVSNTVEALDKRGEGSPLKLLEKAEPYLSDGAISFQMAMESASMGNTTMNMDFSIDNPSRKYALRMELLNDAIEGYDLNLYLDQERLTASSSLLENGTYYGFQYDTFESELRSSYFGQFLDDAQIKEFGDMISSIPESMEVPEEDSTQLEPYIQIFSDFLEMMEPVSGQSALLLDGSEHNCDTISYTLTEDMIVDLYTKLLEALENDEALRKQYDSIPADPYSTDEDWDAALQEMRDSLSEFSAQYDGDSVVTFYIYKQNLVACGVTANIEAMEDSFDAAAELLISFGVDPGVSDIIVSLDLLDDGSSYLDITVVSSVSRSDSVYASSLTVQGVDEGNNTIEMGLSCNWDRESGNLDLSFREDYGAEHIQFTIPANLAEREGAVEFSIENLLCVIQQIDNTVTTDEIQSIGISFEIRGGHDIQTPDYTSISAITEEKIMEWFDTGYGY